MSTPSDAELLAVCVGDADLLERLLESELHRSPGIDRDPSQPAAYDARIHRTSPKTDLCTNASS